MNKKIIINNLGFIFIFAAMIIGERIKTHASWFNIVKSQFGTYVLIILIAIVVEISAETSQTFNSGKTHHTTVTLAWSKA